jgi:phosphatidylinositol alpha-1,6-mannosyltransferase
MGMDDWDPTVPKSGLRYLDIAWQTGRLVREFGAEQVHCAKIFPEGLAAYFVRRFRGIPYVLYAHGEEITTAAESRKLRFLVGPVYRAASALIANSFNTRSLLEDVGVPPERIHTIHPGVDLNRFRCREGEGERTRRVLGIGKIPLLLTVGRLQKRKGQDVVIKALPEVRKRFPDVRYLIVGDGEEAENLRRLAEAKGVSDNVLFAGKVPDSDLPGFYAACDLFIMANRAVNGDIEGFGMVFLEANAAGKPVIGGISGGTRDAILDGQTGVRVEGERPEAVASAIVRLLADPDLRNRMGEAGRRRVVRDFSWDSVVEKTRRLAGELRAK